MDPHLTPVRSSVATHALLIDLEIFDDPDQGVGSWLFADEIEALAGLAEPLKALATTGKSEEEFHYADWGEARKRGEILLRAMEANGSGSGTR